MKVLEIQYNYRKAEACVDLLCYVSTVREIQIAQMANVSRVIVDEKKMTDVPDRAFYNSSFKEIILPWGVASIGAAAFAKCYNLKSIIIPGTVKEVKSGVFEGCSALEEIMLLSGIKTINITGWDKLPSLKSVVSNAKNASFEIDKPGDIVSKTHWSQEYWTGQEIASADEEKKAKMLRITKASIQRGNKQHIGLSVYQKDS